jgi:hypothetical protein
MDAHTTAQDLINQLATHKGAIMEDTSVVALTLAPHGDPARTEALDDLEQAAGQIAALVREIRALGG